MWGDQQDAAANKVTCALVLPGDMAAGRQINRATAGSRDKCKGGQTCKGRIFNAPYERTDSNGSKNWGQTPWDSLRRGRCRRPGTEFSRGTGRKRGDRPQC